MILDKFKRDKTKKSPLESTEQIEEARKFLEDLEIIKEPVLSFVYCDNLVIKPGSPEAHVAGCKCDAEANTFGKGLYAGTNNWQGKSIFAVANECPIHGLSPLPQ